MTKCKISIIVPVYNVEKYLAQCLDTLLAQTYDNLEVLLLNDGSTDGSLKICEVYAEKDKRIKVYSHPNMGLGPTRNRGLELATGEYLAFVDSDDYIASDALEKMLRKAKEGDFDIVQAEVIMKFESDGHEILRRSLSKVEDFTVTDDCAEEFYKEYYFKRVYSHNAWDKIIKRSFVDKYSLKFGDNKKIFAEDNWFQLQALLRRPKIGFVATTFYYYRQQGASIMHSPKKKLAQRHGRMMADYRELLSTVPNAGAAERAVKSIIASEIYTMEALNQRICKGTYRSFRNAIADVSKIEALREPICDLWRKRAYRYEGTKMRRRYLAILGWLYCRRCYRIAAAFVWALYRNR